MKETNQEGSLPAVAIGHPIKACKSGNLISCSAFLLKPHTCTQSMTCMPRVLTGKQPTSCRKVYGCRCALANYLFGRPGLRFGRVARKLNTVWQTVEAKHTQLLTLPCDALSLFSYAPSHLERSLQTCQRCTRPGFRLRPRGTTAPLQITKIQLNQGTQAQKPPLPGKAPVEWTGLARRTVRTTSKTLPF